MLEELTGLGVKDKDFGTYSFNINEFDRKVEELEWKLKTEYLKLPLDEEGVPIAIGDIVETELNRSPELLPVPTQLQVKAIGKDCFYAGGSVTYKASKWRHSSTQTVAAELLKMLEQAVGYSDAHTDTALAAIDQYAKKFEVKDEYYL